MTSQIACDLETAMRSIEDRPDAKMQDTDLPHGLDEKLVDSFVDAFFGRLMPGFIHNMNNGMQKVSGGLQMLEINSNGNADEYIAMMSEGYKDILDLTRDITSIQSKMSLKETQKIYLDDLVKKQVRLYMLLPQVKHNEAVLNYSAPERPVIVAGKYADFAGVFHVLVINALNTDKRSPATILDVTLNRIDERAELCVQDSGPGIQKMIQSYSCNARHPAENMAAGPWVEGASGLYFIQAMANKYKGEIQYSTSPSGTKFCLSLPLANGSLYTPGKS